MESYQYLIQNIKCKIQIFMIIYSIYVSINCSLCYILFMGYITLLIINNYLKKKKNKI